MASFWLQARSAAPFSPPRPQARTPFFPPPFVEPAIAVAAPWRGKETSSLIRPILSSFTAVHCDRQGKASAEAQDAAKPDVAPNTALVQTFLWLLTGVYVFWLFILPYAPGDPLWAIKHETITMLLNLSENFLFILPVANLLGVHILESPAVHPTAEALFNFVMGWSIMFAPMLFTDKRRKGYGGSLVVLWGIQMFMTNTVLVPYMAMRLNFEKKRKDLSHEQPNTVKLELIGVQKAMVSGAKLISILCGMLGLLSLLWFFLGRAHEGFGSFSDRWTTFLEYLSSDRVGYAFIWDIFLYSLFQPWLIGDNVDKIDGKKREIIIILRYIPYLGLAAYLWGLSDKAKSES